MSAPPIIDAPGGPPVDQATGPDLEPADPGSPGTGPGPRHRRRRPGGLLGSTIPLPDEDDPRQARPDPASGVVPIGAVPSLSRPVHPRARRLHGPPADRMRGWIVTAVVTVIGGLIRWWNVGQAADGGTGGVATPLFDEKYYAVQAAEVLRNGGIEDNPAFGLVVHPPLGKQLIALGEMLAGYNPTGWRVSSVIAGTIIIALMVRVVRRMTSSTVVGGLAGILIICDGVSHVQARTALLDVFQELFVLVAFTCLIIDRDQVRARLNAAVLGPQDFLHARGPGFWQRSGERAGIALGARWWRFGCGVSVGLLTAVKWSGFYWIAAFGVLSVIWDITARREAGSRAPVFAVLRRDLLPSLWSLAVVPIATYIASWWAWFAAEDAWARHLLVSTTENWTSPGLQKMAALWQNSLWQWTWKMLDFHSHLLTPTTIADRHPWESKPWSWPLGTRPVLYYLSQGQTGCGTGRTDCVGRIFLIGTPALWWISLFVAGWALWRAIARLDWRYAAVLVAYGAGYFPWFFNLDRQMYFFYVTPLAPFLVIGIALVLGDIIGRAGVGVERRYLSVALVSVYIGLVVANFIWLLPVLQGDPITQDQLNARIWLPSWG